MVMSTILVQVGRSPAGCSTDRIAYPVAVASSRAIRLTAEEDHAWRAFMYASRRVRVRVAAVVSAAAALSESDFEVLVTLYESTGRAMRSSELADRIGWDRSRLSHHAGRLEKRGLLTRERCPDDNRGSRFRMSDAGVHAIRRATAPHYTEVKRILSEALSPDQIRQLGEISDALLAYDADR
jgi:DNA-binding MarR family transcriptional regulator